MARGSYYRYNVGVRNDRRHGLRFAHRIRTDSLGRYTRLAFWSAVATIDIFVIGSILLSMIGFDGGVQLIIDAAYSVW